MFLLPARAKKSAMGDRSRERFYARGRRMVRAKSITGLQVFLLPLLRSPFQFGRYILVRQDNGMRIVRYRAVLSKSTAGDRLREKEEEGEEEKGEKREIPALP
ncbi:hypothetical protein B296_00018904 [Ensete ventricosum]|uniref:Uncharacterized protein n=1 Tax=Ensete ventricosum TaxID=4639 RepID=A0A427B3B3_ENSVE|nr:hypothetical protein B296_00018904 [Ensete ventricosum]